MSLIYLPRPSRTLLALGENGTAYFVAYQVIPRIDLAHARFVFEHYEKSASSFLAWASVKDTTIIKVDK